MNKESKVKLYTDSSQIIVMFKLNSYYFKSFML
jgi:hypothetical protein